MPKSKGLERHDDSAIRRPSPDGTFELRLERPGEIGMGASTWGELRLFNDRREVTSDHPLLADHFGVGIAAVDFYYPWDCTGSKLTVPLLGRSRDGAYVTRVVVYDIMRRVVLCRLDDTWCSGVVWSPRTDEVLLLRHEEAELVTSTGARRILPFPSHAGDGVMAAWTPDGRHVALAPPPHGDEPEKLMFVHAASAEPVSECAFDPGELFPFDEARFRDQAKGRWMVDRDGPSNLRWPGNQFASVMSHWASVLYDGQTSTLTASVFRPTFELAQASDRAVGRARTTASGASSDGRVCVIYKAWIRATIHN